MKVNDYVDFKIVILESADEDTSLITNSYDESDPGLCIFGWVLW